MPYFYYKKRYFTFTQGVIYLCKKKTHINISSIIVFYTKHLNEFKLYNLDTSKPVPVCNIQLK
jgi:hypothetical protein